jgi:hypothetical protein
MRVKAKTVKLSLCPCGFNLLKDDIPLGTIYEVDPTLTATGTLTCGGCQKTFNVESFFVFGRRSNHTSGFLPKDIFQLL